MAELSFVLDIPLMHTLAQASATLIAIVAGFYNARVLSIASDKNRIGSKIKEIQNEVAWKRDNAKEIYERVDEIQDKWDEGFIKTFRDHILGKRFNKTPTSVELMQEFRKYAKEHFTEKRQRI